MRYQEIFFIKASKSTEFTRFNDYIKFLITPVLDYAKWENFNKVIKRAMIACENSGRDVSVCFPDVRKTSKMDIALYEKKNVMHFISGTVLCVDTWVAKIMLELKEEYPDITLEAALHCLLSRMLEQQSAGKI